VNRRSVLSGLGAAPLAGMVPSLSDAAEPKLGELDRFVADLAARDVFSGAVLLAHRGRPVLHRSYGMADRDRTIPNRPDTLFHLASVTKCFTGLAIAQLVRQGKVAYHERLGTYLDGFPAEIAGTVTVHQLLTHTSGVGRPALGNAVPPGSSQWDTVEEVWDGTLSFIRGLPLRFTPGTQYSYSNDGFFVLGAIVAMASGLSYFDYVRRYIFAPAGMRRSDFYTRPQVRADRAIAHPYASQPTGERIDFSKDERFSFIGGPDHGAYSTAAELLGFARALRAGRLLDPPFTQVLTSPKLALPPSAGPAFEGYGYTFTIAGQHGVFGHSGSAPGAANNLDVFPDWVAIVLSNYDDAAKPIVERARQLLGAVR
jgi:CubicO group peptidase (beta-lactamase class C family)